MIRPMNLEDLLIVLSWRNHPEIRRYMFTQHSITADEHREWFLTRRNDATRRLMIVEDSESSIGFAQFNNVVEGGSTDWGFYAKPNAPRGVGRSFGATLLKFAFQELKVHKVCGQAIDCNTKSIEFHKRLGFSREGELRDHVLINGRYHSVFCFGILENEWRPN